MGFLLNLIPGGAQAKLIGIVLAGVTLFGGGFYVAWHWQAANVEAAKLADANHIAAANAKAAEVEAANLAKQQAMEQRIAAADAAYEKAQADAQAQIADLSSTIATGARQLFVSASCPDGGNSVSGTTTTAGSPHARTVRAVIDRSTAQRLVEITAQGDAWRRQLVALQAYVQSIQK